MLPAVAIIVFNRPDITQRLLCCLRIMKPRVIYVISDGPRPDRPGEGELVEATRQLFEEPGWPCDIHREYASKNMGCMGRVSSGLDKVFSEVDRAIILEDDCIPAPEFWPFCKDVLDRYAEDDRVMSISGSNYQCEYRRGMFSYYFSRYPHSGGWATWGRAWRKFDRTLAAWPDAVGRGVMHDALPSFRARMYWRYILNKVKAGEIDSWAYRWTFSCWLNRGVCVIPEVNLITNIGVGQDSTHTTEKTRFLGMLAGKMTFPLRHPDNVLADRAADEHTEDTIFSKSILNRTKWVLSKLGLGNT
jgi:hypothetical protein